MPRIFIANFIFRLSSLNDGKKRNMTAIGIEMVFGSLILSMEDIMLPTSDVLMKNLPALKGKYITLHTTKIIKNIMIRGFIPLMTPIFGTIKEKTAKKIIFFKASISNRFL